MSTSVSKPPNPLFRSLRGDGVFSQLHYYIDNSVLVYYKNPKECENKPFGSISLKDAKVGCVDSSKLPYFPAAPYVFVIVVSGVAYYFHCITDDDRKWWVNALLSLKHIGVTPLEPETPSEPKKSKSSKKKKDKDKKKESKESKGSKSKESKGSKEAKESSSTQATVRQRSYSTSQAMTPHKTTSFIRPLPQIPTVAPVTSTPTFQANPTPTTPPIRLLSKRPPSKPLPPLPPGVAPLQPTSTEGLPRRRQTDAVLPLSRANTDNLVGQGPAPPSSQKIPVMPSPVKQLAAIPGPLKKMPVIPSPAKKMPTPAVDTSSGSPARPPIPVKQLSPERNRPVQANGSNEDTQTSAPQRTTHTLGERPCPPPRPNVIGKDNATAQNAPAKMAGKTFTHQRQRSRSADSSSAPRRPPPPLPTRPPPKIPSPSHPTPGLNSKPSPAVPSASPAVEEEIDLEELNQMQEFLQSLGLELDPNESLSAGLRATILLRQAEASGASVDTLRKTLLLRASEQANELDLDDLEDILAKLGAGGDSNAALDAELAKM